MPLGNLSLHNFSKTASASLFALAVFYFTLSSVQDEYVYL